MQNASSLLESPESTCEAKKLHEELTRFFATEFTLWRDGDGAPSLSAQQPPFPPEIDVEALIPTIAKRGQAEILCELDDAALIALPLTADRGATWVGLSWMVIGDRSRATVSLARQLSVPPQTLTTWALQQTPWQPQQLLSLADAVVEKCAAAATMERREREINKVSQNLVSTYEEISLLYTITQNLRISKSNLEIGRLALDRLVECVPAEGFAIYHVGSEEDEEGRERQSSLIASGRCPLDEASFPRLIAACGLDEQIRPLVVNRRVTNAPQWQFPDIQELILVPLSEGDKHFGWLAAFNHCEEDEFGTVEANLLASLGAMLGIHGSNRELYRNQADFIKNVVRALVSAIDAKDRYTSGHSDRVARFAVRLALELRCDAKTVNTIYLAGLLHDVGKIGIDDQVLRKTDRLTDAEFEHIKLHPGLGYKILADLKQLSDVLPAVLHHHERWDGEGYPHQLAEKQIPKIARIMAVADAYDAMTSDRPYRAGMSDEKVDQIFREGSGSHWDPEVVDAYFAAKSDIIEIANRERTDELDLERELV